MLLRLVLLISCGLALVHGFSLTNVVKDIRDRFQTKLDELQVEGRRDMDKLGEMVNSLGRQFQPAQRRMEELSDSLPLSDLRALYDPIVDGIAVEDSEPGLRGTLGSLVSGLVKMNEGLFNQFFGKNWWEGDNICVETKTYQEGESRQFSFQFYSKTTDIESGETTSRHHVESCSVVIPTRKCKKEVTEDGVTKIEETTWSCCHGFKLRRGQCMKVATATVEETIRAMDGLEFLALLQEEHMLSGLEGPVTVLLPTEEAIEDFSDMEAQLNGMVDQPGYSIHDDEYGLISYRRKKRDINQEFAVVETTTGAFFDMGNILSAHFLSGVVRSDQLEHGQILTPGNSMDGIVRVTVYQSAHKERVVMANCAKIVTPDTMATNGIVHQVDRMIVPAMDTIGNILQSDSQFSMFVTALKQNEDLWQLLASATQDQFTVFAPTDSAFEQLPSKLRNRILSGDMCSVDLMKGHILPNLLCSSIIEGRSKTRNMLGEYVLLSRDGKEMFINNNPVVLSDMIATNGVIHVMEKVLLPDNAMSEEGFIEEVKKESPFMADAIAKSGLSEELSMRSDITLLLPSSEAINNLPDNYTMELLNNEDELRDFLSFHILSEKTSFDGIRSDELFETLLEKSPVRVNQYRSFLLGKDETTVQCSQVTSSQSNICGANLYGIKQVLIPTSYSLLAQLRISPEFSRFLELVEIAEMTDELEVESRTLFAPPNSVFEKFDSETLDFIKKNLSAEIVSKHIVDSVECCSAIKTRLMIRGNDRVDTVNGSISIRNVYAGNLMAENAHITKCDIMATNGVLHYVDNLFTKKPTFYEGISTFFNLFRPAGIDKITGAG